MFIVKIKPRKGSMLEMIDEEMLKELIEEALDDQASVSVTTTTNK